MVRFWMAFEGMITEFADGLEMWCMRENGSQGGNRYKESPGGISPNRENNRAGAAMHSIPDSPPLVQMLV